MATLTLKERVQQLQKDRAKIEARIVDACKSATIRAVEKATEMTPVGLEKPISGTNTLTSNMKQDWAAKSKYTPQKIGDQYKTQLNNDMEYASYVNDGHRMDRHFVPGLHVNPDSGLLEYDPTAETGIVVGTKTSYVPGVYMVDKAVEVWRETLEKELEDIGEVMK